MAPYGETKERHMYCQKSFVTSYAFEILAMDFACDLVGTGDVGLVCVDLYLRYVLSEPIASRSVSYILAVWQK